MDARILAPLKARIPPARRRRLRWRIRRLSHPAWLGTLRRTTPLSDDWGFDRGTPVDRYYIERFLGEHRRDIRGRVLEVRDSGYTDRYGVGVTRRDVLDVDPENRRATIVADLAAADAVQPDRFDCFVLTQTLQYVRDVGAAVAHAHRILRPGGVLLATVPTLGRLDPVFPDYWRFTPLPCASLFGEAFGRERISVRAYGNVLTAIALLSGMAYQELSPRELETHDPRFPMLVAVRAVKAGDG